MVHASGMSIHALRQFNEKKDFVNGLWREDLDFDKMRDGFGCADPKHREDERGVVWASAHRRTGRPYGHQPIGRRTKKEHENGTVGACLPELSKRRDG